MRGGRTSRTLEPTHELIVRLGGELCGQAL
jgi:hypothetical protein